MNRFAWIVCNAFLNKAGSGKKTALVRFLPGPQQDLIRKILITEKNPLETPYHKDRLLQTVHYTWFTTFLRTLPEADVGIFLSCFPENTKKNLQDAILYSRPSIDLTECAKKYITSILYENIVQSNPDVLPIELLPSCDLNTILDLTTSELYILIEYLGIHDLGVEMKQIIDTTLIKKIQGSLSPEKEDYLKKLSQKKEPVFFKRMELHKWDGKPESLKKVITHRGINRLAKAAYAEEPSLSWYISRMLSVQDAGSFLGLCKPLNHPSASTLLIEQILEIIPLIKPKSSKGDV